MRDPVTERTVNISQACGIAGVSRRTIYNWLESGKVEYVRTASGSVRIFAATLFRPAEPPASTARDVASSEGAVNDGR